MMKYKGYLGKVDVDPSADLLSGEVIGIRDVVTFQGRTAGELFQAFKDSVDDYLEFCRARGEKADKPFSGKFVVRTPPEIHRHISLLAESEGKSLNSWINERLAQEENSSEPTAGPQVNFSRTSTDRTKAATRVKRSRSVSTHR
jgi:predicted HicB family RNase H-like nuclease